jgi:ubiquinone biosynthesis protein Coq4
MKDLLLERMYEWSSQYYLRYFRKNDPWSITSKELMVYPQESLGFHLYCFHLKYNLALKPNLEEHDIIHVLTQTGVTVADEVSLQYFLLGNGKKSPYMFLALLTGTVFYPTHVKTFWRFYQRGRCAHKFYDLPFKNMLLLPVNRIQTTFNIH